MSLIHLFFFVGLVSLEAAAATSFSLGSRSILRDIGSNVIADQKDNTVEPNAINFDSVFQDTSAKFAVLEFFAHWSLLLLKFGFLLRLIYTLLQPGSINPASTQMRMLLQSSSSIFSQPSTCCGKSVMLVCSQLSPHLHQSSLPLSTV
ncbi:PREDICTED: uncharacterized protein LOC106292365 [Brassica oleracea var. oleracea]|uniref:uncharacterized protein LOC106292365 n=1 Tax=Brassica oleracea var. oleracea TaxID=109376 RepID=UPI0006A6D39A|nr:PREDICTED: uncharacterized protein LOC106292365 [Brassica oleracea var. oleracea]